MSHKAMPDSLPGSIFGRDELLDSLDGIVWILDLNTLKFTFVSAGAERILGYPLSDWEEGIDFLFRVLHPEDRDDTARFCLEKTRALENHDCEYRMLAADGRVVWIKDLVTVCRRDDQPVALRGMMIDITAKIAALEAKRAQEELFRAAFENTMVGMAIIDPDGLFFEVNEAFCAIFGYQAAELKDTSFLDLTHPDDRESCRDFLLDWSEGSKAFLQTEKRYLHRDGKTLWGQVSFSVINDLEGRPARIVCQLQDVTETKLTREELLLFQSLINRSNDSIFIIDPASAKLLYVNDKACDTLDYSRSELLRMRVFDYADNIRDEQDWQAFYQRLRYEGRSFLETSQQRRDGSTIPVEVNVSLVQDCQGEYLVSVARDVTERRRMEDALQEEKNKIDAIVDAMGDGIAAMDREFRIIYQNGIHRTRQGEHIGERCYQAFHGRETTCDGCALEVAFESGEIQRREVEVKGLAGNMSLEVTACPLRDVAGGIVAGVEVVRDVTERKQTEELLRQSEHNFRQLSNEFQTLLDGIPDSIVHLDPDFRILWANAAAQQLFLRRDAALVESPYCYQAFHGYDAPCQGCPVFRALQGHEPGVSDIIAFDDIHLEIRTFPMREADGRVSSVIVLKRDVTDKVKMEQEAMRTAHLISLGELAAGVAHEINNPINGIINYAQILQDRIDEKSRNRELTERILKEGDRIGAIVANLLFFARHDSDSRVPVSIREVLMDALFLAQPQLRRDQVKLQIEIDAPLPSVLGVPQKIEQVFLNILHNARDALNEKFPGASPDKLIRVTTALKEAPGRPSQVRVVFEDRGNGIPADMLSRVTTPFFTTKPVGKGTGLGLSISHNIVVDHGGHLVVESETGRFTRVRIDFPACAKEGT